MFRPTALLNAASKAATYRTMVPATRMAPAAYRFYSSAGLSQADIETRVLDILRGFDKVDTNKVMYINKGKKRRV
jgi:NADH dehydrogenase (ubiquinone) 1 alpha/beta subcomplex 1